MQGIVRFVLLSVSIILRVNSFGTAPTTLSPPRGLSYEAITELARKRYPSNQDEGNRKDDDNESSSLSSIPMKGRVAVITGAAGGIGGELSKIVFRLGGTVVALDRNTTGLEVLQRTLVEASTSNSDDAGIRFMMIPTNHEDLSSVASAAEWILSRFDRIDLLINNAGILYREDQAEDCVKVSAHGKDLAFTVNYLSHFLLTEKLMPSLSNEGRVVHITSTFHWKVDGSELSPSNEDGEPIAYQSDPEKQGPNHLGRSYANTKLAQLWHSRSIAKVLPKGCSSVCACPLWAATGIAGEKGRDALSKYAFSISDCGPGITSSINAMLRTDDELGDALNDGKCFVANANIVQYEKTRILLASDFVTNTMGWRDIITDLLSLFLLFGQRFTHEYFTIQKTSPESFNDKQKRDQFYQWSKDEVKQWL